VLLRLDDAGRHLATAAVGLSSGDVRDAITTATQARDAAMTILENNLLTPW
jgi:hypothetical protein